MLLVVLLMVVMMAEEGKKKQKIGRGQKVWDMAVGDVRAQEKTCVCRKVVTAKRKGEATKISINGLVCESYVLM